MASKASQVKSSSDGVIRTRLTGYDLLNDPRLNKGTAFTEEERGRFALHGLLPPHIGTLEDQIERRKQALESQPSTFAKYAFLRDLQDSNETLFYSLITHNVEETLPIVYTPGVGEGCQRFSEIWRKPRGVFLSYPNKHRIPEILAHPRYDQVKCIVVSDGERILGLGDQGAGGMGIPIGKMALYTALGGIAPEFCLPILLDVGTDNEERLKNPVYIGWRNKRVRGPEYDEFVEAFVAAVESRWPNVLLQWEDFAGSNAARLLNKYRNRICTFNDDIQGTAAVTTGTLLSAVDVTGVPIEKQRIVVVGFGTAGLGVTKLIASFMQDKQLSEQQAYQQFYAVDVHGLLVEGVADLRPEQKPFARKRSEVDGWSVSGKGDISLLDVVRYAKPTVLIGVSGQAGVFTEEVVKEMVKNAERPIIFPLSNPTSRSEAKPQDLLNWTQGRALIGTGSPFEPVNVNGKMVLIDQTNNSYVFPGLALGIISSRAKHVSDGMIKAAAKTLADLSPVREDKKAKLLPPMTSIRAVSVTIARAVGEQAIADGLAAVDRAGLETEIQANVWEPVYQPYELVDERRIG